MKIFRYGRKYMYWQFGYIRLCILYEFMTKTKLTNFARASPEVQNLIVEEKYTCTYRRLHI